MASPYGQSPYAASGAGLRPGYAPGSGAPAGFNNGPQISSHSGSTESSTDAAIKQIREATSKVEDLIDTHTQSIKPYLPALGRFLIVVTFLEDALRIVTQWSDQKYYLQKHRHFPWGIAQLFLIINVIVMVAASGAVIARRYPEQSVAALLGVVIVQGFGYGLIFDINFFLRNLSVIGGLLMVLSDSLAKKRNLFAGLPSISESDKRVYLQLAGRVLLIFLFIGFIIQGNWSVARVIVSILGLGACVMVAVGFKARWSASFLILLLSVFNILVNNFWVMHHAHPARDFLRYDFFQTLSIVGGLLLLVNQGPGGYSLDERKKAS
ncbi:ER-derived vesicles protein erv29 [Tilletia horrida]|uniref:ER-derived vesicles protein erv29 n=1 Tax=Tilletia horrida TaxID=155126 RepID=A0AAN6GUC1_9BASI|nr:ER-derived vesicles protein erv29 [Tilletia horrida]KAK0556475.1 ER-derived vesicles protein erv29 [Tilletia horrida]KAK0569405.1 ER-derived vesicles protein erv29 [Tilletia horrida]